jgi:hypothetical protein
MVDMGRRKGKKRESRRENVLIGLLDHIDYQTPRKEYFPTMYSVMEENTSVVTTRNIN